MNMNLFESLGRIQEIARHADDIEAADAPAFLQELADCITHLSHAARTRTHAQACAKLILDAIANDLPELTF